MTTKRFKIVTLKYSCSELLRAEAPGLVLAGHGDVVMVNRYGTHDLQSTFVTVNFRTLQV